jgi:hypothetical protein
VIVVVRGGRTALEQIHEGAQLPQQVEQGLGLVPQLVGQSLNAVEKLAQSGVGFVAEGGGDSGQDRQRSSISQIQVVERRRNLYGLGVLPR